MPCSSSLFFAPLLSHPHSLHIPSHLFAFSPHYFSPLYSLCSLFCLVLSHFTLVLARQESNPLFIKVDLRGRSGWILSQFVCMCAPCVWLLPSLSWSGVSEGFLIYLQRDWLFLSLLQCVLISCNETDCVDRFANLKAHMMITRFKQRDFFWHTWRITKS